MRVQMCSLIMLRADDLNLGPLNVADGQIVLAAQPRNVDTVWIDGVVRKQQASSSTSMCLQR
jgi:cytosine/adenosine deaminase-related metal-dependent hydrolase